MYFTSKMHNVNLCDMAFPSRINPETLGSDSLAVVESLGWSNWSLREIAKTLRVSPNALYRYVEDREGLVVSIGAAAAQELHAAMRASRYRGRRRLLDYGRRYVTFAVSRPHAFAAFVHAKPSPADPRSESWTRVWSDVLGEVHRLLPRSSAAAAFAFWSLIHGRAELALGPASLAEPTAGLDAAIEALLLGFAQLGDVQSPLPTQIPT